MYLGLSKVIVTIFLYLIPIISETNYGLSCFRVIDFMNYPHLKEWASYESTQPFSSGKMETLVLRLAVCRRLLLIVLSEIAFLQGIM